MNSLLNKTIALVGLMPILLLAAMTPTWAQSLPASLTWSQLQLLAQPWAGTLTYLDYRSGQPVTLPTELRVHRSGERELTLNFTYQEPNGQLVSGSDTLEWSADGRTVTWSGVTLQLRQNTVLPGRVQRLVLEGEGQDDGKSCLIRKTLELGPGQVSVKKEVRYGGAASFITRNTYFFPRQQ